MSKLYKDKDNGFLVYVNKYQCSTYNGEGSRYNWLAADIMRVEYAIKVGRLILIGNNFMLK